MFPSSDIPDCFYPFQPTLVCPKLPTPEHSLYLSNLDDQKFLRFSIKYLYLYKKSVPVDTLKSSLSRVLVDYYPLAGRLRTSEEDDEKLQIDCNGQGALFAEAFINLSAEEFLPLLSKPNRSWRKLLYREESQSFLDIPPLVIQVTHLRCGALIICMAINHCLADGLGTCQFLHAWAHMTTKPSSTALPVGPFHFRELLRPLKSPKITKQHPEFTVSTVDRIVGTLVDPTTQHVVPTCFTFTPSQILQIRKLCVPSNKCTSFEALASHVWRAWVRSLGPPPSLRVKLLFSVNVRGRLRPQLPAGYYGNGFVLGCAETTARELARSNVGHGVERVQEAKRALNDDYVRSMIDLLEERRARPDLSATLVISQWAKLGLEDVDFGEGKPLHMGPLASEIYCLFLPVVGNPEAITVLMSVPERVVEKFECCMRDFSAENDRGEMEKGEQVIHGVVRLDVER
ncbi:alcohol acyltransferase 9-like [Aristolochia californica]|uniref:alcohol acyltransferase 9-like n=1 Tax=Aristolochia californica TaxID=171875 RepID=UPI0035E26ADE